MDNLARGNKAPTVEDAQKVIDGLHRSDRPRRKQPPELVMDLAGIPCREVSDALREAVEATNQKV